MNDIDEEFYLWISWQWQSSWHCKYLLTWKKNYIYAWKKNSCTRKNFWDEYSVVTSVRPMPCRQPFDVEWDFIWHNAYHKVTLTQNSDVMKKYPAGKNTIFKSVTKNCLSCLMLPQKWTSGKIKYLLCGTKCKDHKLSDFRKSHDKLLSGSNTQKYFIQTGRARKIFHSVVTTCPLLSTWALRDSKGITKLSQIQPILPYKISCNRGSSDIPLLSLGHSVIRDQNYPQSISCAQRAATGCSVCY